MRLGEIIKTVDHILSNVICKRKKGMVQKETGK
jgi:hypothetical protein